MFFLLYVPTLPTTELLTAEAIDQMAEQFAEQLLQHASHQTRGTNEQFDANDVPALAKRELRAQLAAMMQALQQERVNQIDEEDSAADDESQIASPELGEVRDFLERCYRESA
jgi:hypothetical protein